MTQTLPRMVLSRVERFGERPAMLVSALEATQVGAVAKAFTGHEKAHAQIQFLGITEATTCEGQE